tara:strand:+ start:2768 stop:3439 length:672 start_codon:yes stop_codon:yes gene_type:complete
MKKFIYKTKFRSFNVGTTEITIQNNDLKDQKIITIDSFSNRWIDLIYKLRHHSTLVVNQDDYSLSMMTQKVQQADYRDSFNATVNYDEKIIYYENLDNIASNWKQGSFILPIDGKVYDPFAIIYYLQNIDISLNQQYLFNFLSKTNIKSLKLEVIDKEQISSPYITSLCYLIVPNSAEGQPLLKHKGEMRIWYTDDASQLPIKIQQKMRHGIMELLLIDYFEE